MTTASVIAGQWRSSQPGHRRTSGIVLIWGNQVYGWKNSLRDPEHERPGALAVDIEGRTWRAMFGNDERGALAWIECRGSGHRIEAEECSHAR